MENNIFNTIRRLRNWPSNSYNLRCWQNTKTKEKAKCRIKKMQNQK